MRLCKKIKKSCNPNVTIYSYQENEHNTCGPAKIFHYLMNVHSIFYKENGFYKNRRKGPYVIVKNNDYFYAAWLHKLKGGIIKAECLKDYYNDSSISKIRTYRNGYLKSRKYYEKGTHFDNIEKEIEIAKQWI